MSSSSAQFAIRQPRLIAYQQLLTALDNLGTPMAGASVWMDFLNRLPLTLGESAAERSITYSLSDTTHDIIHKAVEGLLDLIKRRAEPDYDHEKKTALLPDERERVTLWPKRYCPRTIPRDSSLRKVIRLSLQESPDLDAGLMESWLSRPAGGRPLLEMLSALSSKFIAAGRSQMTFSGVTLMSHLALLDSLLYTKKHLKKTSLKNTNYATLDRAVGMALHACFHQAVSETLASQHPPPAGTPEHRDNLVLMASSSPLLFLSIRKGDLNQEVNPYGLSEHIEDMLWPIYQPVLEHGNQPQYILKECLRIVCRQQMLLDNLLPLASCEGFRRLTLDHLTSAEDPGSTIDQLLAKAFYKNEDLLGLLEDPASLSQLISELNSRVTNTTSKEQPMNETKRLGAYLDRIRASGLRRSRKKLSEDDLFLLQDLIERFVLRRMDEYATANIQQSLKRVVDRRRDSPTSVLIQDYQAGRLYRISDDEHPLLKGRIVFEEAQLFVDLKGYTRRTARAKELVMAEFLKKEFYEPILEAAKAYYAGMAWNPGESIQLVNLLGDAAAFSGHIVSLVDLAYDIQKIFRRYTQKLQELAPMEEESAFLSLKRRVEQRRKVILSELERLQKSLRDIEKETHRRRSLPAAEMAKQLQADYQKQLQDLQREYLNMQTCIKSNPDPNLKARLDEIQKIYEDLKNHRKQTLERLQATKGQDREQLLGGLLCQKLANRTRELESRIHTLEQEDRALIDSLEEERHLHQGSGLEAGLFISYGAASEVIQFDDDLWGLQRVAVCERLNESARGTARNSLVKRNIDDLLATARVESGDPKLELPFRVYISQTRPFDLEPSLNRLWTRVLSEKNPEVLKRFISSLQQKLLRQIEQREDAGSPLHSYALNDIYNLGEAISESALDAYLNETRSTHFFFRIQMHTKELHPEIHKHFLFIDEVMHLVVGKNLASEAEKIELFRYVGQILFRGFEVTFPSQVFEIMRFDSKFVKLLQQHHLSVWLHEALQDPGRKIEDLKSWSIDPERY